MRLGEVGLAVAVPPAVVVLRAALMQVLVKAGVGPAELEPAIRAVWAADPGHGPARPALLGSTDTDRLWVADRHYAMPTLDTEVGTALILPHGSAPELPILSPAGETAAGSVFTAVRPGITRVEAADGWAVLARVARHQYAGRATNRHPEPEEGDDE